MGIIKHNVCIKEATEFKFIFRVILHIIDCVSRCKTKFKQLNGQYFKKSGVLEWREKKIFVLFIHTINQFICNIQTKLKRTSTVALYNIAK